jgi:hypothetical protein
LYKNKEAVSGGTYPSSTKGFTGYSEKTVPTGTKKGWSKSLPQGDDKINDKNLKKIRKLIRAIYLSQEER